MTVAQVTCPSCAATYDDDGTRFCGRCGSDMHIGEPGARRMPDSSDPRGPQAAPIDPLLGSVIDGRYRVTSKIGQGGMGAVYRVEHTRMGKVAAMKVLHPVLTNDPELVSRFHREAEAISRLSHPNTVQVFDFGQSRGFMYLVMELVKGEDLGAILRRDGALGFDRARPMLMQVCEALGEAHEAGIVHRDLKPENLLVSRTREGRDFVKVLDFGLAKLRDVEELNQVTARGSLIGTPYYMSPEQIRSEDLDARSDVYSLGALLYRMVTGEHAFTATTPLAVLTQHLNDELEPPSARRPDLEIPPIVDVIVGRAMAKERGERYASADELLKALERAPHVSIRGGPSRPPSSQQSCDEPSPTARDSRDSERRRQSDLVAAQGGDPGASPQLKREDLDAYERSLARKKWVAALVLPLLAAGAAVGFWQLRQQHNPPGVEEELEPNNSSSQANPIDRGHTVRGHLGAPLDGLHADRDFYRVRVARGPHVLHVDTTGVPRVNLLLEVYDAEARSLVRVDDDGPGDGEDLPNLRLEGPGDFFLMVSELPQAGRAPSSDLDDWYTLTAGWKKLDAGSEAEPDDTPAQALPLTVGQPMRGFAGRLNDVDYYYLRGDGSRSAEGTLEGTLSGVDGVDLRLIVLPSGATSGPPGPLPPGARVFDAGGPGVPESFAGVPWPTGSPAPLLVVERKDGAMQPAPAEQHRPVMGTDEPYSLNVRLSSR